MHTRANATIRWRHAWAYLVACILAIFVPRTAHSKSLNAPVHQHRLANGLRVVLAPDVALADVTVVVRYDVGSADDPNGLQGLAHLVEHLQFQGSKHVAPGEHARLIEAAGGTNMNAKTLLDATAYFETVPPEALALALWLESDRMGFAADRLDEATVAHERTIVAHEYRSHVLGAPLGLAGTALINQVFPPWHPYHTPDDHVGINGNVRAADVKAFLRTWYSPANATLILVGDFDETAALALVKKYFEGLPSVDPPVRPSLPATWQVGNISMDLRARVFRKWVAVAWKTPAFRQAGDRELDVAARILAGPKGMLVRRLVDPGLATAVFASQTSRRQGSSFDVIVQVADGVTVEPIRTAIELAIAEIATGVPDSDVAHARESLADRALLSLETSAGRASRLALLTDMADPWEVDAHADIDSASLAAAVRGFLIPQARVVLVVYPDASTVAPTAVERHERRPDARGDPEATP